MLKFKLTNPNEPYRIFIYGDGGLGKSTFGAFAENPLILAVEKGSARLRDKNNKPVAVIDEARTWDQVVAQLRMICDEDHAFKTLVIDSATELEQKAHQKIVGSSGKSIITVNKGFGAGASESDNMHKNLLDIIEEIRLTRDMNIIITGHAQVKMSKDPQAVEDYEQFEPRLLKGVSALWKEYVDAAFFVRLKTLVKTSDEVRARAVSDGTRICMTTQSPAHYAKNRFGLPDIMNFDLNFWDELNPYIKNGRVEETASEVLASIVNFQGLLPEGETATIVAQSVKDAGDDIVKLKAIRERLKQITNQQGA